jgi:hypothetical protein
MPLKSITFLWFQLRIRGAGILRQLETLCLARLAGGPFYVQAQSHSNTPSLAIALLRSLDPR